MVDSSCLEIEQIDRKMRPMDLMEMDVQEESIGNSMLRKERIRTTGMIDFETHKTEKWQCTMNVPTENS